jgi:hypothetical protein
VNLFLATQFSMWPMQFLLSAGNISRTPFMTHMGSSMRIPLSVAPPVIKKPDHRLLPIDHPPFNFKANKGHCVHNYAKFIFAMSLKPKKDKKGCTSMDAKETKRQMSWTLHLHAGMFPVQSTKLRVVRTLQNLPW